MKDLGVVLISILVAVVLADSDFFENIIARASGLRIIGSLVAGFFFTSLFTVAPAAIVLAEIAQANSVYEVALLGGVGAVAGDFLLFRFVRDRFTEDILHFLKKDGRKKIIKIMRLQFLRWLMPFLGALIIASPLPDELGLALMGLAKIKTSLFILLAFVLNSLGILFIGLIAT